MTTARGSIAVVIPTKNGARFIGDTLRSVLSQSRPADTIVVVDDDSSDETAEVVRAFEPVCLIQNAGRGSNPARATAIAATDSEYIAFLDHDDLWLPHHLETLVGLLDQAPYPVAYSEMRKFTATLSPEPISDPTPRLVNLWDTFPANPAGGPSQVVVRRSSLERIGGWPSWDRVPSDIYVWFRLADLGPFCWWPASTAGWRWHDASQSYLAGRQDSVNFLRDRLELLREALGLHLAVQPEDTARLTGRIDELGGLVEILSAMCRGDSERLVGDLERYDPRDGPSAEVIPYLVGGLRTAMDGDAATRGHIWRAYGAWPRDHRDLRRVMADPVVVTDVVSRVRRHPSQPARWGLPLTIDERHAVGPLVGALMRAAGRKLVGQR